MNYPPTKTKPWAHQTEAWRQQQGHKGFYYAMDMGCGKSKAAVDYVNGYEAHRVLIICPKKVIAVWPEQFELHSHYPYKIYAPEKGTIKKKAIELHNLLVKESDRMVVVLNYDAFWRPPLGPVFDKKNKLVDPGILMRHEWDIMINDENHRIKSPGGRGSWGAMRIGKMAKRRLALSGTPMPHSPTDIYAQFRWLDPNIFGRSFLAFRKRYCEMGGYGGKQVIKFINQDDLSRRFYSRAYRVTANEVLDLPDVMHIVRKCELSDKTMKAYHKLNQDFMVEIMSAKAGGQVISVTNALTKFLRLAQMTGGLVQLDDGQTKVIDNNKIEVIDEIFEDLATDEPIVVFTRFTNELQRIKDTAQARGRKAAELSGHMNQLAEWKAGKYNVLVAQIQAGSEGIDLTRARYCIYFSTGESLGQYEQSLARTHRPGQTRKVIYYHILAKGTIDEKIYRALKAKKKIIDYVLEDMVAENESA